MGELVKCDMPRCGQSENRCGACERMIPGNSYSQPAHLQDPWWRGFNDARDGREYDNIYQTLTAKFEYQLGYHTGGAQ